jgi:FkbM family methyltransferase
MSDAIFHTAAEESRLLLEYLGPTGVFVDVGANDPVINSQSWALEQAGWTGVCVEPQPRYAQALRAQRRATVVQKACGAPGCTGQTMTLTVLGTNAALEPERVFTHYEAVERVDVELDTLDNIVSAAGLARIDFLSLDVEGYETEVLRGFDLARWQPRLVLCEDHWFDHDKRRALERAGYRWVRRTEYNDWYVPRSAPFPVSLRGRWQLFRKAWVGLPFRVAKRKLKGWLGR